MPVSNVTLMKIAAIGGFATASMGFALRWKVNQRICETCYYQEAINCIKSNRGAKYLLGDPINVGKIDVSDSSFYANSSKAHFGVPVRGTKDQGVVYFWANKEEGKDHSDLKLTRIELQLDSDPKKRLLVLSNEKNNS